MLRFCLFLYAVPTLALFNAMMDIIMASAGVGAAEKAERARKYTNGSCTIVAKNHFPAHAWKLRQYRSTIRFSLVKGVMPAAHRLSDSALDVLRGTCIQPTEQPGMPQAPCHVETPHPHPIVSAVL